MAGKFLSLEEAARLLGVSTDEVHRLVDRKKLFPMRDGTTAKFKSDDVERLAESLGDDESAADPLALDLESGGASAAPGDDDLVLGDADDDDFVLGGSAIESASQTIMRRPANGPDSGLSLGEERPVAGADDDLALESIIGASSPSLAGPATGVGLELDDVGAAPGSGAAGSRATGSIVSGSGAGAALSGPLDSGLSLETADVAASGIDLAAASGIGGGLDFGGEQLGGDAFELGGDSGDDDSASVVIATEESGDSSFFGAAMDDSASVAFDDPSISSEFSTSAIGGAAPVEYAVDTTFSAWQIVGLTACALLLLTGGLVMFDLVWTIRGSGETAFSAPLLQALAKVLPW
jgi:excisionase family DNA binding protein